MSSSHILMLAPAFPWPANTGGLVRIAEVFRGLQKHFRVTLMAPGAGNVPSDLTAGDSKVVATPQATLGRVRVLTRFLLSRDPYHATTYQSRAMARKVEAYLQHDPVDLVYCHFIYSLEYIPSSLRIPVCVDSQNVDRHYWGSKVAQARGLTRLVTAINAQRVVRYEAARLPRIHAYVCVSTEDNEDTRRYACPPVKHVLTAPNGVDLTHYIPQQHSSLPDKPLTLGFLGSLDVGMNIESMRQFYLKIWPRIRAQIKPAPRLLLIGRNPAPSLIRLTEKDQSVQFTGTVTDTRPWLEQTDISIAPLVEGAGTKLKTLEAMAMGLPIVGTPLAFQGLNGTNTRDYFEAATDEEFTHYTAILAASPERRVAMGTAARKHVEQFFGWDAITDRLAEELSDCFGLHGHSTPRRLLNT